MRLSNTQLGIIVRHRVPALELKSLGPCEIGYRVMPSCSRNTCRIEVDPFYGPRSSTWYQHYCHYQPDSQAIAFAGGGL
jgi:hypothetical protein